MVLFDADRGSRSARPDDPLALIAELVERELTPGSKEASERGRVLAQWLRTQGVNVPEVPGAMTVETDDAGEIIRVPVLERARALLAKALEQA